MELNKWDDDWTTIMSVSVTMTTVDVMSAASVRVPMTVSKCVPLAVVTTIAAMTVVSHKPRPVAVVCFRRARKGC